MDTGIPPLFACMTSSRVVTVPAWPTFWQRTPSFIFLDEYASSQTHLFLPFLTGALAFAGAFFGAVFVCLPAGADTAGASCKFHQTMQSNFHQVTTQHHGLSSFKCLQ
jgi:hypothetical protein